MNETVTALSPDCRALFRWVGCAADFQPSFRTFYAVFFGIHAVSTIIALIYTAHAFFSCCGLRRIDAKNRKLSLRIFTCLSIVAFCSTYDPYSTAFQSHLITARPSHVPAGHALGNPVRLLFLEVLNISRALCIIIGVSIYCFFMIDPRAYGMPAWLAMALWAGSCNCLGSAAALLVLTWAEALSQNKNVKGSEGFLKNYRWHYAGVILDRCVSTGILALAGADLGSNSYMILVRVFCAHWSLFAVFLVAAMLYYGRQMRERISFGAKNTFSNVRDSRLQQTNRLIILYVGTASSCAVFAALQAGLMHILDSNPAVWLFFLSCFHVVITVLATWFIIGRPSENQLTKKAKGASRSGSSGSSSNSPNTSATNSVNNNYTSSTASTASTASTDDEPESSSSAGG